MIFTDKKHNDFGSALGEAVSDGIAAAAARIRTRVSSYWFCGGQGGTGAGDVRVLRFYLSVIHYTDCSTVIISFCHPELLQ